MYSIYSLLLYRACLCCLQTIQNITLPCCVVPWAVMIQSNNTPLDCHHPWLLELLKDVPYNRNIRRREILANKLNFPVGENLNWRNSMVGPREFMDATINTHE